MTKGYWYTCLFCGATLSSVPVEKNRPSFQYWFLARKLVWKIARNTDECNRNMRPVRLVGEKDFEEIFNPLWGFIRHEIWSCVVIENFWRQVWRFTPYFLHYKMHWCKPLVTQPAKAKYLLTEAHATRIREQGKYNYSMLCFFFYLFIYWSE